MQDTAPPPSPHIAGIKGRCPRCGEGRLFSGYLTLKPRCEVCGLDFGFADSGDGPAVFVIFIAGFVVAGLALVVEFMYEPPYYIHALLWTPLAVLMTLAPLRPLKGLLIAMQYRLEAAEGRVAAREDA